MKFDKIVLIINGAIYFIAAIADLSSNTSEDILPTLGLTALIMGILNAVAGIILSIAKRENSSRTALLTGGALLVMGFGLCTLFPYRF